MPALATLPPLVSQALASFASVNPWPLQALWPLQSLLEPLPDPFPLQSLPPSPFTAPPCFASLLANAAPLARMVHSAPAIIAPFIILLVIFFSLVGLLESVRRLRRLGYGPDGDAGAAGGENPSRIALLHESDEAPGAPPPRPIDGSVLGAQPGRAPRFPEAPERTRNRPA